MENELTTSKKNSYRLPYAETALELSGDFDSGNLNSASIHSERNVRRPTSRNYNSPSEKIKKSSPAPKLGSISGYRPMQTSKNSNSTCSL